MNSQISILPMSREEEKNTTIYYSFFPTQFGQTIIGSTLKGICYIGFGDREDAFQSLMNNYPHIRHFEEKEDRLQQTALQIILSGQYAPLVLHVAGTAFQLKVWNALLNVPLGQLSTYTAIASQSGNAKAVRAAASAVGRNPVSFIIPCHRVIRNDGGIGGFYWGVVMKKQMIDFEKQICEQNS